MTTYLAQNIDDQKLAALAAEARDFAHCHGILIRPADEPESRHKVVNVPFTLLPSPFPRSCYENAYEVHKHLNLLMHRVALDKDFLFECLQHTIKVDDYTRHLWDIYETVEKEGVSQSISLELNRSDYMLDCENDNVEGTDWTSMQMKQVEFNTIASGMAALGQQLSQLHRIMVSEVGDDDVIQSIPDNTALDGFAQSVLLAWRQYGNTKAVFVTLSYDVEWNLYDQKHFEYAIRKQDYRLKTIRRSLKDFEERGSLTEDKRLIIDGFEVAIIYQRSCYSPKDFQTEQDWATRLMIERSKAIKSPNVPYHLAGTKKVQQELARPGQVERFIQDKEAADLIRSIFAGLYTLDRNEEGDANIEKAIENPQSYVLKPQREGGGNNFFGDHIPPLLKSIRQSEERMAYILMDRIFPPHTKNYTLRRGPKAEKVVLVGEFGIFGSLVGTSKEILRNEADGHVLRSKTHGNDEGGIAAGIGVMDSPFLV